MTTLVGVAQRGWSGQICDLPHLRVSFLFFLSFLLSSAHPQVALPDRCGQSICQNVLFSSRMCLFEVSTIFNYIQVSNHQRSYQKLAGMGISQPNRQSHKIGMYPSPMKIFMSNFTDRVITKNCKIMSNGVVEGLCDLLLEFWDPLNILGMVEDTNFKFGIHIKREGF